MNENRKDKVSRWLPFLLGPFSLLLAYLVLHMAGGLRSSPLYPLIYLLVLVFAAATRPSIALSTLAFGILLEILTQLSVHEGAEHSLMFARVGFMALFSSLPVVLVAREIRELRGAKKRAVDSAIERVHQDALDFRLIGASLGPESLVDRNYEERLTARQVGSVRAIHDAFIDVLEVARSATEAETALFFVLDPTGAVIKLKECVTSIEALRVSETPRSAAEGALGAVVKTKNAVNLRPKHIQSLGYQSSSSVGSLLAVPVMQDAYLTGVLVIDRESTEPFTMRDETILYAVAREAQRAIESERIFAQMDQVKYEQERFYRAFSLLNEALTISSFAERLLDAVREIKAVNFMAVTLYDEVHDKHQVVAVQAADQHQQEAIRGLAFRAAEGGLVAMAVKNGHPLPYIPLSAQQDSSRKCVFGNLHSDSLESVKVFPLSNRGLALGTLVVGSTIVGSDLSREEERMLETISAHAAITLANAQMYKSMERMATTDGLTGLVNHRQFKKLLGEALNRATRFSREVSVLMVDADHFKSVNDTYGHSAGDEVLKRLASCLLSEARKTDVVARYGGEEFVVILDETGSENAEQVAERIRQRIANEVVEGDFGKIRVTVSQGLCTWPMQAESMAELLERADQALYAAKKKGRNCVEVWRAMHCTRPSDPVINLSRPDGRQRVEA